MWLDQVDCPFCAYIAIGFVELMVSSAVGTQMHFWLKDAVQRLQLQDQDRDHHGPCYRLPFLWS